MKQSLLLSKTSNFSISSIKETSANKVSISIAVRKLTKLVNLHHNKFYAQFLACIAFKEDQLSAISMNESIMVTDSANLSIDSIMSKKNLTNNSMLMQKKKALKTKDSIKKGVNLLANLFRLKNKEFEVTFLNKFTNTANFRNDLLTMGDNLQSLILYKMIGQGFLSLLDNSKQKQFKINTYTTYLSRLVITLDKCTNTNFVRVGFNILEQNRKGMSRKLQRLSVFMERLIRITHYKEYRRKTQFINQICKIYEKSRKMELPIQIISQFIRRKQRYLQIMAYQHIWNNVTIKKYIYYYFVQNEQHFLFKKLNHKLNAFGMIRAKAETKAKLRDPTNLVSAVQKYPSNLIAEIFDILLIKNQRKKKIESALKRINILLESKAKQIQQDQLATIQQYSLQKAKVETVNNVFKVLSKLVQCNNKTVMEQLVKSIEQGKAANRLVLTLNKLALISKQPFLQQLKQSSLQSQQKQALTNLQKYLNKALIVSSFIKFEIVTNTSRVLYNFCKRISNVAIKQKQHALKMFAEIPKMFGQELKKITFFQFTNYQNLPITHRQPLVCHQYFNQNEMFHLPLDAIYEDQIITIIQNSIQSLPSVQFEQGIQFSHIKNIQVVPIRQERTPMMKKSSIIPIRQQVKLFEPQKHNNTTYFNFQSSTNKSIVQPLRRLNIVQPITQKQNFNHQPINQNPNLHFRNVEYFRKQPVHNQLCVQDLKKGLRQSRQTVSIDFSKASINHSKGKRLNLHQTIKLDDYQPQKCNNHNQSISCSKTLGVKKVIKADGRILCERNIL